MKTYNLLENSDFAKLITEGSNQIKYIVIIKMFIGTNNCSILIVSDAYLRGPKRCSGT